MTVSDLLKDFYDLLRSGRHVAVGDFFTVDGDKIRRLVIFFGHEL